MLWVLLMLTSLCQCINHCSAASLGIFIPQLCLPLEHGKRYKDTVAYAMSQSSLTYTLYDACSESSTIGNLVDLFAAHTHEAIIGPGHTELCEPLARLASATVLVSWRCPHPPLAEPYPAFVRTLPSSRASGYGLVSVLAHFLWRYVSLVVEERAPCRQWARDAYYVLTKEGFVVKNLILITGTNATAWGEQLKLISAESKAIVLCVDDAPAMLSAAHSVGLTTGAHALFLIQALQSPNISTSNLFVPGWADNSAAIQAALKATFILHAHGISYLTQNYKQTKDSSQYSAYDAFLYDAVTLASEAVLSSEAANGSPPSFAHNRTFKGLIGNITIDATGDMETFVSIWDYDPALSAYRVVLEVSPERKLEMSNISIHWPGGIPVAPDTCDFEDCDSEGLNIIYVIIIFGTALALVAVALIVGWFVRRRMIMRELERGPNKILLTPADLVFVSAKTFKSTKKPDLLKASEPSLSQNSFSDHSSGEFSDTARYNGDLVFVKELFIKGFEIKGKVRNFLKQMREMRHENTNLLIGCYIDPVKPSLVWEHCSRRSLEDVINNEDIKLDWDFKLSLLTDLVKGMRYLHSSVMKYHGCLKSGNCVIDSRWVLKVTDYGLNGLYERYQTRRERVPKDLLWTAPELLRNEELLHKGTQKGDVFSFAIITQEVILRGYPYCMLELDAEEIIRKVRKPPPLIRPSVSQQAAPPQYIQIMKQCWTEMPDMRPDFEMIHQQYKDINRGKKLNIVDTMFKMLEKYSTDLEDIVRERTTQLEEEKKKTENLLSEMLPASVAKSLMMGHRVDPESFEEVTIYFSDIVGFTTISAMSTPMQVVDLLNDLYTMFDSTIDDYDVYKVETIGDAYMVVSGLPKKNGDRHAGEISTMALDLLSQCGSFRIRHLPEIPLRLRIGIHTGSCVTGVVGLRMPRYCLFGDTVNTASRMESTGSAFRVHISSATKSKLDILGSYNLEYRGETELKGKGLYKTYWLTGKDGFTKPLPEPPPLKGGDNHGLGSLVPSGNTKQPAEQTVQVHHEKPRKGSTSTITSHQSISNLDMTQLGSSTGRLSRTSMTSIGASSPVKKSQSQNNICNKAAQVMAKSRNIKKVKSHSSLENGDYEAVPIGKVKRNSCNSVTTVCSDYNRTLSPSPITIEEKYPTSKV